MTKTVLVLDDEPEILELMEELLKSIPGVKTVISSSKYSDAYSKLKNQKFDIIFTDYKLGGTETGLDFIKEIRQTDKENYRKTNVFLISGQLNKIIIDQAKQYKVKDILVKPFSVGKLAGALKSCTKKVAA